MFKALRHNITAQIFFLIVVFMICFIGFISGAHLLQNRQNYLQSLLDKEYIKTDLSHILQKKVLAVNVQIHDLSGASSMAEMQHIQKTLSNLQSELLRIIEIIAHGGRITIKNLINFDLENSVPRVLQYTPNMTKRLNPKVLEFRADISEIGTVIRGLEYLVKQKIYAMEGHNSVATAENIRKVDNYYKGVAPFIDRVLEHSAGLLLQSQQETDRARDANAQFIATYQQIEIVVTAVVTVFIFLVGGITLRSTRNILHERQKYQQELKEANDNLARIIKKRTDALLKEIEERKNVQDQVKQHADFLSTTIESLSHPFYVVDARDYSIILANSEALSQREGEQATCYALTHGRDLPCDHIPCTLQMIRETGEAVVIERASRNKEGEEIYREVHGHPIFDDSGELVQMIEYSLDITAKKMAEAALRQANIQLEKKVKIRTHELEEQILQRKQAQLELLKSERHYRRIIENISDIITIVDSEGVISYVSPSSKKVLGIPPATMIGRNIREVVDPEDIKAVDIRTLYNQYGSGGTLEYRTQTSSGEYLLLESRIHNFKQDDGSERYLLSSRDITLRKRSEEENNKLRLVVEQSPSSVVITDKEGTIEYVNPTFERVSGYSLAEAVGQNPRILKSGKTPESAFKQLWSTITSGHVWRGEFINKKKNGEFYDENVLVIPIIDTEGNITNFAAVKENITEIKKAKKQAEKANRAKSDFLSQMSHELRTPLNAINGFSQLLLKSKKNPLNDKQKGMAEQIYSAGKHLLSLINEILDLARIESREFTLSMEEIDPETILNDCLALILPLAEEKQVVVTSQCEGNVYPFLWADLTRTKQVLINLLSNAVKYNHPTGMVDIYIDASTCDFLKFIIRDTGIGISPEKQKDIFLPFSRAVDNPDDIEGTGIGMAITQQLVAKMGGQIGFESEFGQGSSFWFTLPVSVKSSHGSVVVLQDDQEKEVYATESTGLKEVLYIEDNLINIALMEAFFAELDGFCLSVRTTGEDGLVAAREAHPDLILMDLNLPGIDGFQTLKQLKETEMTTAIPAIAISADIMDKTVRRIFKSGFAGYAQKPVDISLLHKTMLDVLEKKS